MIIEQWRAGEICFLSNAQYNDPFLDVTFTVTFTHEDGTTLVRPGFWDGENKWCVRFAPTILGKWSYVTACSNKADCIDGVTGEIECVAYTGEHEIYKRGFLKVSPNKRYFVYNDGTPFYYLGDTHWLMLREPYDTSNVEGIDSAFCFTVDYRVTQGFTVYQSEPIGLDFAGGFDDEALKRLKEMDRRFKYIADSGLVHANAQITFAGSLQSRQFTPEFVVKLSVMWAARYGAYPVLWTVAQEVDPDFYHHADVTRWFMVGETLYLNDCYKHPLTGHMCNQNQINTGNTLWGDKYYHSWFGMQPQGMAKEHYADFYNYKITKPILLYETGYEHLWSSYQVALRYGYFAMLLGSCGYGYGAHGVWNGNVDTKVWMNYGGYMRWFEGVRQPGAKELVIMNSFFRSIKWYELVPHFDNAEYWDGADKYAVYASLGDHSHFVLDYASKKVDITLRKLENGNYTLLRFDMHSGAFEHLKDVTVTDGTVVLNAGPTGDIFYVLTTTPEAYRRLPLDIFTENHESMLTFKGDTLKLVTPEPCTFTVDNTDIATVDENGVITAMGKNGMFTVTATNGERTVSRKFIAVRQDKTAPHGSPENITMISISGNVLKAPTQATTVVPVFTPENHWEQNAELIITDEDGNPTPRAFIDGSENCRANYVIHPISDGDVYVSFKDSFGKIFGKYKLVFEGYGKTSLTAYATVEASDWFDDYDVRGLPQRAVNGSTERFSGWASQQQCSYDAPITLTVTLKDPAEANNITLYLTDLAYNLQDFDVIIIANGEKKVIGQYKDNKLSKVSIDFDKAMLEKIQVICYKGDAYGNARIDQINAALL